MSSDITREFPSPTRLIASALADLQIARSDDEQAKEKLGPLSALARPWDPATCPPMLRREVWVWLDRVAGWLNREYTWQAEKAIPSCWPAHPHIVHELAVLACLRLSAGHALTADPLEEWHRYTVPLFFDRMLIRLGGTPCQPGKHTPWPGKGRYTEYDSPGAVNKRNEAFNNDTGRALGRPTATASQDGDGRSRPLSVVTPAPSP